MRYPVKTINDGMRTQVEVRLSSQQMLTMPLRDAEQLALSILEGTGYRGECPFCGEYSGHEAEPLTPREPEDVAF